MSVNESQHDVGALAAHLEDRLSGPERERLLEHLAGCAACRETLAMLVRNADFLPHGRHAASGRWTFPGRIWLPLAATLVVATAVASLRGRTPGPEDATTITSPATPREPGGPSPATGAVEPPGARPERPISPAADGRRPGGAVPAAEPTPALRGAERRVGGKTFRLVAGEWIDTDFDAAAALPLVEVKTGEARSAILARVPDLAAYASLGDRVLVVHAGTVYRFRPGPPA